MKEQEFKKEVVDTLCELSRVMLECGGRMFSVDELSEMSVIEFVKILAPNGVGFVYRGSK